MKKFDRKYLNKDVKYLAGVDEAGRGPLAGPVVAAAVIFNKNTQIKIINDQFKMWPGMLRRSRNPAIGGTPVSSGLWP